MEKHYLYNNEESLSLIDEITEKPVGVPSEIKHIVAFFPNSPWRRKFISNPFSNILI